MAIIRWAPVYALGDNVGRGEFEINMTQLQQFVESVVASPILDGVLITNLTFPPGQEFIDIYHNLGRVWQGWFEVGQRTGICVLANPETSYDKSRILRVGDVTGYGTEGVSLWVF